MFALVFRYPASNGFSGAVLLYWPMHISVCSFSFSVIVSTAEGEGSFSLRLSTLETTIAAVSEYRDDLELGTAKDVHPEGFTAEELYEELEVCVSSESMLELHFYLSVPSVSFSAFTGVVRAGRCA